MARNGPDDTTRRDTSEVAAVEGLLAYAHTRWRGSRARVRDVGEAVGRSRALAGRDPLTHTPLLVRSLRSAARVMLGCGRPGEALPYALEAVALARPLGGPALVMCLATLTEAYEALNRYSEAAAAAREAGAAADPPP
ncbi:hypothetical protein HTZ77_06260 [Nonomuraea sp. SMC257]|uniref:Tetratricopeptide repeat protein n=1 Tax=Nonomuraea montanisoli TaxID=2741721 RepID=A0A7Y6M2C1_9ACTN|nr:hypothetical protein [Nonomuraea montanisoli]NUW31024.1 hypothetical protein [Nonomuraea montanisoli]